MYPTEKNQDTEKSPCISASHFFTGSLMNLRFGVKDSVVAVELFSVWNTGSASAFVLGSCRFGWFFVFR